MNNESEIVEMLNLLKKIKYIVHQNLKKIY